MGTTESFADLGGAGEIFVLMESVCEWFDAVSGGLGISSMMRRLSSTRTSLPSLRLEK